jgi:hypothetical protein
MVFPCGEENENGQPPSETTIKHKKVVHPLLKKVLKGFGRVFA